MIFIIEGADRTGKTTLANRIVKDMGAEAIHCGPPKTSSPFNEYADMMVPLFKTKVYVFDRFYLGEYVYSQLWRGGLTMGREHFRLLDHLAAAHQAIVIHATADTETVIKRCRAEGENLLAESDIDKCKLLFEEIMNMTLLPVIRYDSSNVSIEEIFRIIQRYE